MSQLTQFQTESGDWISGTTLYVFLSLVILTALIIWLLPKFSRAFPAPLAAILVVFAIAHFANLDTKTVGDIANIQ